MADRNTPAATFEEWRVEFNELATDVGDIAIYHLPLVVTMSQMLLRVSKNLMMP